MFQKNTSLVLYIILCIALTINVLQAQSRFKGGIVGGFNASQLDGDASAGYNKMGLNAGIRGLVELGGRLELNIDMLFSQRGSRTTEKESIVNRSCTLNYLEVPVLLNIRDWLKTSDDGTAYHKVAFSIGAAYSRLFKASSNPFFSHVAVIDKLSTNDVAIVAGLNFNINEHWGINCRLSKSFTKLFDPGNFRNDPSANGYIGLRGHHLSFQTAWIF